jgi:methylated-DNA-[protein]-cysteine S-methyltransferase
VGKTRNSFCERVYILLNQIPKGKVVTYSQIASKLNSSAYRAVGNCLNKNENLIKIPCHRVIRSNGEVGGYALGSRKKTKLLKKEGVEVINRKIDLDKFGFKFN